jgi:hypothetical protein
MHLKFLTTALLCIYRLKNLTPWRDSNPGSSYATPPGLTGGCLFFTVSCIWDHCVLRTKNRLARKAIKRTTYLQFWTLSSLPFLHPTFSINNFLFWVIVVWSRASWAGLPDGIFSCLKYQLGNIWNGKSCYILAILVFSWQFGICRYLCYGQ